MNGVHDMGGMHNLGPIGIERDEPWFHAEWERRVFALTLAAGALGEWNLDRTRFTRESMPANDYLASTYYEKWLFGIERLLVERGLVTQAEIDARRTDSGAPVLRRPHPRLMRAAEVAGKLARGSTARVEADLPARFVPGQRVRARNEHPTGHTRLPRYARGRLGTVARDHGVFIFADAHAMGHGPQPQHLYSVRFAAGELWGTGADARDSVCIDLWDDHLDPAP